MFDENCPQYFAPNERKDFLEYLSDYGSEYIIYEQDRQIKCAFGLNLDTSVKTASIRWIMVTRGSHQQCLGKVMMQHAIERAKTYPEIQAIAISASQHSAPFFAKWGAVTQNTLENGWGPEIHRVGMLLPLKTAA